MGLLCENVDALSRDLDASSIGRGSLSYIEPLKSNEPDGIALLKGTCALKDEQTTCE
jgi:hypothetical protein